MTESLSSSGELSGSVVVLDVWRRRKSFFFVALITVVEHLYCYVSIIALCYILYCESTDLGTFAFFINDFSQ